jgi:hypothetical protein
MVGVFGMLNVTPMVLLPPLLQQQAGFPDTLIGEVLAARGAGATIRFFVAMFIPERNNFRSALTEQYKVASGGTFFVGLLLILLAVGAAGLQVQTVVSRWRDYGILQAVGFTPGQVLLHCGLQLALVLASGIAVAAVASLLLTTISTASLIVAAGLTAFTAGLASLPVLLWPLWRPAAEVLRDAA